MGEGMTEIKHEPYLVENARGTKPKCITITERASVIIFILCK